MTNTHTNQTTYTYEVFEVPDQDQLRVVVLSDGCVVDQRTFPWTDDEVRAEAHRWGHWMVDVLRADPDFCPECGPGAGCPR